MSRDAKKKGRGAGIPVELKKKLAEHFEANGYTRKSRTEAPTLYENLKWVRNEKKTWIEIENNGSKMH